MYDAVDDPYTYENSTVLINKLDLEALDPDVMLDAMIASFEGDEKKLARAIRELVAK
jgi:cell filamentation protein